LYPAQTIVARLHPPILVTKGLHSFMIQFKSALSSPQNVRRSLTISVLLSVLPIHTAFAVDWFVDPVALDTTNCGSQADPCQTIGYTLSKVGYGDVVYLAPFASNGPSLPNPGRPSTGLTPIGGESAANCLAQPPVVFNESNLYVPTRVDLIGGGQRCTEINANGVGRILDIATGPVTISGITFRNGDAGTENSTIKRTMAEP